MRFERNNFTVEITPAIDGYVLFNLKITGNKEEESIRDDIFEMSTLIYETIAEIMPQHVEEGYEIFTSEDDIVRLDASAFPIEDTRSFSVAELANVEGIMRSFFFWDFMGNNNNGCHIRELSLIYLEAFRLISEHVKYSECWIDSEVV